MQKNYNKLSKSSVIELNNKEERFSEYRKEWDENPIKNKVSEFPLNIDIELTNACNLKCPYCARTTQNWGDNSVGRMKKELVEKILNEVDKENGYCVKFSLRGEPLVYKDIFDILKHAKNTNMVDYYFNTNGVLLTPENCKNIVEVGLPRISISVAGWDKESFEKSQVGATFEELIENIKYLKKHRDSVKSDTPKIRLQGVLTPELQEHITEFKSLWESLGDELGCIDYREESEVLLHDNLDNSDFKCNFLWQRLVVLWDGSVYPCLFHGVKENKGLMLGNVKDSTLKELWSSPKLQEMRRLHSSGKSHNCDSCRFCSYRTEQITKLK